MRITTQKEIFENNFFFAVDDYIVFRILIFKDGIDEPHRVHIYSQQILKFKVTIYVVHG